MNSSVLFDLAYLVNDLLVSIDLSLFLPLLSSNVSFFPVNYFKHILDKLCEGHCQFFFTVKQVKLLILKFCFQLRDCREPLKACLSVIWHNPNMRYFSSTYFRLDFFSF